MLTTARPRGLNIFGGTRTFTESQYEIMLRQAVVIFSAAVLPGLGRRRLWWRRSSLRGQHQTCHQWVGRQQRQISPSFAWWRRQCPAPGLAVPGTSLPPPQSSPRSGQWNSQTVWKGLQEGEKMKIFTSDSGCSFQLVWMKKVKWKKVLNLDINLNVGYWRCLTPKLIIKQFLSCIWS